MSSSCVLYFVLGANRVLGELGLRALWGGSSCQRRENKAWGGGGLGVMRDLGSVSTQQWPGVWELTSPLPLRGRVPQALCAGWVLKVRSVGDVSIV